MKSIFFLSFISATLLLVSCKKTSTVTIQAQDYITGEGEAYAGMEFRVSEKWTPGFEPKTKVAASGFLDDLGYANFDLKMNPNRSYILSISQPDNICYGGIQLYYLDHEKSNFVELDYLKCGDINLPRVNVNCEGSSDKFRFKYYYTANPDVYIYTGYLDADLEWQDDKFLEGCIDYSSAISFNSRPAGDYTIEWMVERPSGTTTGIDYFTIAENGSTTYLIEY